MKSWPELIVYLIFGTLMLLLAGAIRTCNLNECQAKKCNVGKPTLIYGNQCICTEVAKEAK